MSQQTLTSDEAEAIYLAAVDARKYLWFSRDLATLNSALKKLRKATTLIIAQED